MHSTCAALKRSPCWVLQCKHIFSPCKFHIFCFASFFAASFFGRWETCALELGNTNTSIQRASAYFRVYSLETRKGWITGKNVCTETRFFEQAKRESEPKRNLNHFINLILKKPTASLSCWTARKISQVKCWNFGKKPYSNRSFFFRIVP